jgi:GNAT superfamily N-acetyltransferase
MRMQLRLMISKDIPEAMRLKDLAGWNQTHADWERFLYASPEGCFVAECAGRLVGTSTTMNYEERFAWIGMVLVDLPFRGQGIGTTLLRQAIQYLDDHSIPCIKLDATPQGKPLYEKLGFVTETNIERWLLKRQQQNNQVVRVSPEIEAILRLDREIFGADRSGLLRSLNEAAPDFTLITRQEGEITGYAFGRRGSRADHLGPWMARNEDVAVILLDEFLRRSGRDVVFIDCVGQNPWVAALLKTSGFEFSRPLTRMFRGANKHAGQPQFLCAILGPEFG